MKTQTKVTGPRRKKKGAGATVGGNTSDEKPNSNFPVPEGFLYRKPKLIKSDFPNNTKINVKDKAIYELPL